MNALEHEQLDEQLDDELDDEHEDEHEDDDEDDEEDDVIVVSISSRFTLMEDSADMQMELIMVFMPAWVKVSL